MTDRIKLFVTGAAVAVCSIAAGYWMARVPNGVERGEARVQSQPSEKSAIPTSTQPEVKKAWDGYVEAQRAYMAALKASKENSGSVANPPPTTQPTPVTQSREHAPATPVSKQGKLIAFDETSVDLGTVDQGTESIKMFVYRNKGSEVLKILDTTTSCGCTVAEPNPREVPPGGFGQLRVSFKSGSFSGNVEKTITVRSNDPTVPSVTLALKANIRTLFVLDPKVVDLGEVERGKPVLHELAIKTTTADEFVIQRITTTHPELRAEVSSAGSWKGLPHLLLTFDSRQNYGSFTYAVRVYITRGQSGGQPLELTIPVKGIVAGPVRVKPESLFLGSVKQGELFKPQKLTLSSRNGKPVEIRTVDTDFEGLKAEVTPVKPGVEFEVALNHVAPAPTGFFQHTMRVITTDSDVPLEVKVTGVVLKPIMTAAQ